MDPMLESVSHRFMMFLQVLMIPLTMSGLAQHQ